MKTLATGIAFVSALCFGAVEAANQQDSRGDVDLSPQFTADEFDQYELTLDADIEMSLMGSSQTIASYMESRFSVRVMDVQSEISIVEIRFDRILVQFDGYASLDGSYDSAAKRLPRPDEVLPKVVQPAINKPITVEVDGWGRMISVDGLEGLAPEGHAGALFLQLFDDNALYSMFQPVFRVRPQQESERRLPVNARQRVGSSWSVTQPEIQSLNVRRQMLDLTLEGMTSGDAQISISGKPNERVPENAKGMPGVETTTAQVTGTAVWDTVGGELASLNTRSVLELGSTSGGFGIEILVTSTTELDRVD